MHRIVQAVVVAAAAACLLLLLHRLYQGITFLPFSDEAMHLVGARVLNAGGLLYRDFIDLHGPLIFALLQLYGHFFGWAHPNGARWIIVMFGLLAVLAVACGTATSGSHRRLFATALFAGLLATVWLRQGLYLISFYTLAGALAVVCLSCFVAGTWRGARPPSWQAFLAGFSLAMLGATAYSFLPSVALFALSGGIAAWRNEQSRALLPLGAGAAVGGFLTLLWLLRFADPIGYLAFHIGEGQIAYPPYIGFSLHLFLQSLVPKFGPDYRIQAMAVVCTALSLAGYLLLDWRQGRGEKRHTPEILLGFAGILALNARGLWIFQDGGFLMAALAMAALCAAECLARMPRDAFWLAPATVAISVVGAEYIARHAFITPPHLTWVVARSFPFFPLPSRSELPEFARIRELVHPDERMLALTYSPETYLMADRLPMQGFYTWFPWDADYVHSQPFGWRRDLCAALRTSPPPVITYNAWAVWGHDPHGYMQCLFDTLQRDYMIDPNFRPRNQTLYVRRDRMASTPPAVSGNALIRKP